MIEHPIAYGWSPNVTNTVSDPPSGKSPDPVRV